MGPIVLQIRLLNHSHPSEYVMTAACYSFKSKPNQEMAQIIERDI